jgi:aquaporin Z
MELSKRLTAEFIGTLWLVLGGCGSAVLAAAFPSLGIGFVGVSLAFGLTVLTMAFAIGHVSGCHLNPAVSVGLWAGGRFPASDLVPYVIVQVLGGIAGAGIVYIIASGHPGFDLAGGLASNGYGWALSQLWLFWVAPLIGAVLAGVVYRWVGGDEPKPAPVTGKHEPASAS